jgi:hypothetical protein
MVLASYLQTCRFGILHSVSSLLSTAQILSERDEQKYTKMGCPSKIDWWEIQVGAVKVVIMKVWRREASKTGANVSEELVYFIFMRKD